MKNPVNTQANAGENCPERGGWKLVSTRLTTAILPFIAVLLVSLCSCQDHRIPLPGTPNFRIKKVSVTGDRETSYTTFTYNGSGQLTSIYKAYTRRASGGNLDTYYTSILQYDAQGRVVSFDRQPDYKAPGTVVPAIYTYEYDDKGTIVTINYVLNPQSPSSKRTYQIEYATNSTFPSRIKSIDETSSVYEVYDYTYAGNNVVAIKKTSPFTSLPEFNYTRTYQFDDKPNPFYGLYPGIPDPDLFNSIKQNTFFENNIFNQNNMLLPGQAYEYDSYGNLIKSTGSFSTTYEYEQY